MDTETEIQWADEALRESYKQIPDMTTLTVVRTEVFIEPPSYQTYGYGENRPRRAVVTHYVEES